MKSNTNLFRRTLIACLLVSLVLYVRLTTHAHAAEPDWQTLAYAPAAADNPLKGLVPYVGAANPDRFPHSMEFSYFALSSAIKGLDTYDWSTLERFLDAVAARGHQAVFRFYAEYPGKQNSLPDFLLKDGLQIFRSQRADKPPRPPLEIETPDYNHPELRQTLVHFIKALGARYDGDPRIGFITAGLLGHWGEWHNYPLVSQFASKAVQAEVIDAYQAAFHVTRILLRYPAGDSDPAYVSNASRPFGLHDDSFAWSTLGDKSWYFVNLTRAAGRPALDKWKTQPIGGEIRPEAWGLVFDEVPGNPSIENFRQCVDATHVSWLMDSGMFKASNPEIRRQHAIEEVRHMGYEFHVPRVAIARSGNMLNIALAIENRGVAPFYYAWPMEFALSDHRKLLRKLRSSSTLTHILPDAPATIREQTFDLGGLQPGDYQLLLRVANPLPNGQPVRFANSGQDKDAEGWLTLGEFAY